MNSVKYASSNDNRIFSDHCSWTLQSRLQMFNHLMELWTSKPLCVCHCHWTANNYNQLTKLQQANNSHRPTEYHLEHWTEIFRLNFYKRCLSSMSLYQNSVLPSCLQIHQNVLFNWKSLSLKRRVRPILYYDSFKQTNLNTTREGQTVTANSGSDSENMQTILELARQLGWETYEIPRLSPVGMPYFKEMFYEAARRIPDCMFYGYSNSDIMFDDGLIDTLDGILEVLLSGYDICRIRLIDVANIVQ